MLLNQLLFLIAKNSLWKRLVMTLPLLLLSACQSLPPWHHTSNPETVDKHQFSLVENQSVFGQVAEIAIEEGDSLPLIARYFGLGFDEITLANPDLDPWLPEQGHSVNLPLKFILPKASQQGVILNLAAKRLFYYPANKTNTVFTYPIGIGRKGWKTPTGKTTIIAKKAHPRWFVPKSILAEHLRKGDPLPKIVAAGPNNPLGEYALRLGIPGYLIHGTNKPYGVGMAISHGCVRLYPENISQLFNKMRTGIQVHIVNQPFLIGWNKKQLYIQVYPTTHISKKQTRNQLAAFKKKLKRIEGNSKQSINWPQVDTVIERHDGIPVAIFANSIEQETVLQFSHPVELNQKIKPAPLVDESWRIKVAEFPDSYSASRLAVMLNHQGPPIPAHILPADTGYIVAAGPFQSAKEAQSSANRLRIDFELQSKLIQPGYVIPGHQQNPSVFPTLWSVF